MHSGFFYKFIIEIVLNVSSISWQIIYILNLLFLFFRIHNQSFNLSGNFDSLVFAGYQ